MTTDQGYLDHCAQHALAISRAATDPSAGPIFLAMARRYGDQNLIGWAVVREYPWDLAGMFKTHSEALSKAGELGPDYTVQYGERQEDPDGFRADDVETHPVMIPGSVFEPGISPNEPHRAMMSW